MCNVRALHLQLPESLVLLQVLTEALQSSMLRRWVLESPEGSTDVWHYGLDDHDGQGQVRAMGLRAFDGGIGPRGHSARPLFNHLPLPKCHLRCHTYPSFLYL